MSIVNDHEERIFGQGKNIATLTNRFTDFNSRNLIIEQRNLDLEQRNLDLEQRNLDLEQRVGSLEHRIKQLEGILTTQAERTTKLIHVVATQSVHIRKLKETPTPAEEAPTPAEEAPPAEDAPTPAKHPTETVPSHGAMNHNLNRL